MSGRTDTSPRHASPAVGRGRKRRQTQGPRRGRPQPSRAHQAREQAFSTTSTLDICDLYSVLGTPAGSNRNCVVSHVLVACR